MKKTIKTLMLLLGMIVATGMNAADELDLKVNDQQDLVVEARNVEKGALLILQNASGEVLYKDGFFTGKDYFKVFNFNTLPDGVYTLLYDRTNGISKKSIIKRGASIKIDEAADEFVFKPTYNISDKNVHFQLSNPREGKIYIEVFDAYGKKMNSFMSKDMVVKHTLDFSRVPSGSYIVRITAGDHTFEKELKFG